MTSLNLKDLEKKAYLSYHQDGLLETGIGLYIVLFAVGMYYDVVGYIAGFIPVAGFALFAMAKKMITVPRIGMVKFGPERRQRMKKEHKFFIIFFTFTLLSGVLMFFAFNRMTPEVDAILKKFIMVPLGFLVGLALIFVGYWKQLSRFYGYGLILMITVLVGPLVEIQPPIYWGAGGLMISLFGLGYLIRFVHRYSLSKE